MKLRPLQNSDLGLVGNWLSQKQNYEWLDFENGPQILTPTTLKIMMQRDTHLLRLFAPDSQNPPVGLVALGNINRKFKTAMPWCVLGNKDYNGQGLASRAVSAILSVAFSELGLEAVNAWTVAENRPAIRVLEHNHFRLIGNQRRCHYIDGRPYDRLLFDLLASEHKENGYCG